jgi:predicted alpha/beta-hydrolase family hydrolase
MLIDGASSHTQLILAHGAGAPMDHPFMNALAAGIAAHDVEVVRFEFAYMAARRKAPDRQPVLLDAWRAIVAERRDDRRLFIGGKSMGGRMASMVADELGVDGLLCFGYPFHPPGKPQQLRVAHLATLVTPTLIVQGTRDAFGHREEVAQYVLSPKIEIRWLEREGHSMKAPGAIDAAVAFIATH